MRQPASSGLSGSGLVSLRPSGSPRTSVVILVEELVLLVVRIEFLHTLT